MRDLAAIGSGSSGANHGHWTGVVGRQFTFDVQHRRLVIYLSQSRGIFRIVPCDGFDAGRSQGFQFLVRVYLSAIFYDVTDCAAVKP
jgi:hypothetical protein